MRSCSTCVTRWAFVKQQSEKPSVAQNAHEENTAQSDQVFIGLELVFLRATHWACLSTSNTLGGHDALSNTACSGQTNIMIASSLYLYFYALWNIFWNSMRLTNKQYNCLFYFSPSPLCRTFTFFAIARLYFPTCKPMSVGSYFLAIAYICQGAFGAGETNKQD